MSDIDDCASEKNDASPPSDSASKFKRHSFVQAILNADVNQTLRSYGSSIFLPGDRVARLPRVDKKDFTQNWIIAHSNIENSPKKSCPTSPILGVCAAKRSPESPILGCQWKRIKSEVIDKKNCRVSLSEKFREAQPVAQAIVRFDNEREQSKHTGALHCRNDDSVDSLKSAESPVFNQMTRSPTLNTRLSGKLSWLERTKSPEAIHTNTTSKWNIRRSLVREVSKIAESLSLSSPLDARSENTKIEGVTDNSDLKINKCLKELVFDILAEETPVEDDVILPCSEIPETLSVSTLADEIEKIETESENLNDDQEKLPHNFQWCNPIKIEPETTNQFHENAQNSKRSSIPTPVNINGLINDRREKSSWINAEKTFGKPETIEPSKDFYYSSELKKYLDGEYFHQKNRRQMLESAKNLPTSVRSVNNSWIEPIKNVIKVEAGISSECKERLKENRGPAKFRRNISTSTVLTENESIYVESTTTTAHDDVREIESNSDATISDFIENVDTQNVAAIGFTNSPTAANSARPQEPPEESATEIMRNLRGKSCDSDETYYSNGDSIPKIRTVKAFSIKNSQRISQSTSHTHEGRVSVNISDILISPAPSPIRNNDSEAPVNTGFIDRANNNYKKKKKGKKGSLMAKLQTIISSQVSNLRIWRYQMSRSDFKISCSQFVVVKVQDRETRYGRHYLTVSIDKDPHDLLNNLFESTSDSTCKKNAFDSKVNTLTLVLIPEVVGVVKIKADGILNIYPPWEIMDKSRKIISVMFYNVISVNTIFTASIKTIKMMETERIVEEFECPCVRSKALDERCPLKFCSTKPSVMQEIFGS